MRTIDITESISVLQEAKGLLKNNGWIKKSFAVDKTGQECAYNSDDACAYCLEGAIFKAADVLRKGRQTPNIEKTLDDILLVHYPNVLDPGGGLEITDSIVAFNDNCAETKDDVLNLIDLAIRHLKERKMGRE